MDHVVDVCEIPQVLTVPNHGLHLPRSRLRYHAWEKHRVARSENPGRPDGHCEEPIHTVGLQDELLRLGLGLGVVVEGLHRGGLRVYLRIVTSEQFTLFAFQVGCSCLPQVCA